MNSHELRADAVSTVFVDAHNRRHTAVDNVDLVLAPGSSLGIVGQSGSGKSSLARMLAGLARPSQGAVRYNGDDIAGLLGRKPDRLRFRGAVQFIGQDTTSSFDPMRTLRDSVRTPAQWLLGMNRAQADGAVDVLLPQLALSPDLADRYPREVSGGQRQRFAIARALIVEPRILICDEIVSALDVSIQGAVLNFLKAYVKRTGAGLAFISHGLAATAFIADELMVMLGGRVIERGLSAEVIRAPKHEHTAALVDASRGKRHDRQSILSAEIGGLPA
jgi:peptide/nickel transport system ATP-binding protein